MPQLESWYRYSEFVPTLLFAEKGHKIKFIKKKTKIQNKKKQERKKKNPDELDFSFMEEPTEPAINKVRELNVIQLKNLPKSKKKNQREKKASSAIDQLQMKSMYWRQQKGIIGVEKVIEKLKTLSQKHPESSAPLENLGLLYSQEGDSKNAIRYFQLARRKGKASPQADFWLLREYEKEGLITNFKLVRDSILKDPNHPFFQKTQEISKNFLKK